MPAVPVEEKALWITTDAIDAEKFSRIFWFFVINSPVNGLTARQKSLLDYGWSKPWHKPYCLRRKLNEMSTNKELIYSAQTYDAMDVALRKSSLLVFPPLEINTERVCIYNGKRTQYLSLFYHIRNAIAHGRFSIVSNENESVLIMEDVTNKRKWMDNEKKTCSARMVLRISTLLKWIDYIEGGESQVEDFSK